MNRSPNTVNHHCLYSFGPWPGRDVPDKFPSRGVALVRGSFKTLDSNINEFLF